MSKVEKSAREVYECGNWALTQRSGREWDLSFCGDDTPIMAETPDLHDLLSILQKALEEG